MYDKINVDLLQVLLVFYHACEMKIKIHPYGHLMSSLLFELFL